MMTNGESVGIAMLLRSVAASVFLCLLVVPLRKLALRFIPEGKLRRLLLFKPWD